MYFVIYVLAGCSCVYYLNIKITLMNPCKINFHHLPQVGNLIVSLTTINTNNNSNNTYMNNQPKHIQQKYIFKYIKRKNIIKHQIIT